MRTLGGNDSRPRPPPATHERNASAGRAQFFSAGGLRGAEKAAAVVFESAACVNSPDDARPRPAGIVVRCLRVGLCGNEATTLLARAVTASPAAEGSPCRFACAIWLRGLLRGRPEDLRQSHRPGFFARISACLAGAYVEARYLEARWRAEIWATIAGRVVLVPTATGGMRRSLIELCQRRCPCQRREFSLPRGPLTRASAEA